MAMAELDHNFQLVLQISFESNFGHAFLLRVINWPAVENVGVTSLLKHVLKRVLLSISTMQNCDHYTFVPEIL